MINICFNLDEKYVMPCKVLMRQIEALTNDKITFHLIGIQKTDMTCKNSCKFYPNPDLSWFSNENLSDYYYFSKAAMYRLLIPFLINADKAIYMDIDIILKKDIKELYDKKIDFAGAVPDTCEIYHKKRLGLSSRHYYNSGLILFNCKKIRENMPDYKERIIKAQEEYILDLKDQDIFNIVFKGHIKTLGYEWNVDAHNLKEKEETKRVSDAKDKAYKNPCAVHCMGKEKWWTTNGLAFGDYWDKFAGRDVPKNRKTCFWINNMLIVRN